MPAASFLQGKNTLKTYYLKNKFTNNKPGGRALNKKHSALKLYTNETATKTCQQGYTSN